MEICGCRLGGCEFILKIIETSFLYGYHGVKYLSAFFSQKTRESFLEGRGDKE